MFIITLHYKVDLERVDHYLGAHVQYLNEQYEIGNFLMSGKTVPRTGGVILSNVSDKEQLLDIIAKDPFKKKNIATYEITEFIPSKTCEALTFLKE